MPNSTSHCFLPMYLHTGDTPSMTELLSLKGKTRSINIATEISTKWYEVGTALLNDTTGVLMPEIEETCRRDTRRINYEILR